MNNSKRKFWIAALVALALMTAGSGATAQDPKPDPCADPNNLTNNCRFDSFAGEVPTGWTRFDEVGHPAFDQSGDSFAPPSLRIWSDGVPFTSGIYQQVPNVTPGRAYIAAIGWAPTQSGTDKAKDKIERMLGIDPLGGTDSTSPNVVWGPAVLGQGRQPDLQVSAVAQNATITVFARVRVPQTHGKDEAFLDQVGLRPDPNQPAPTDTPIPPTDTPIPPTDTPAPPTDTPIPPTDTPVPPTDTPLPTETPTLEPTATPTHTPIPPATAVALSNNPSLRPKATAGPRVVPAPESRFQPGDLVPYIFLFAGFASFGGAAVMIGLMVWLWRSKGTGGSQKD